MRTNIVLDEALLDEASKFSDQKTKTGLIHLALREFVENHKRLNLSDLRGKIKFAKGYNYKAARKSQHDSR